MIVSVFFIWVVPDAMANHTTVNASISGSPTTGAVPLTVSFTLNMGPSSDILCFDESWSFSPGDGNPEQVGSGTGPVNIQHTYTTPGTYTAQLLYDMEDQHVTGAGDECLLGHAQASVAIQAEAPAGQISGMKFHDLNANGLKDSSEPGLSGFTITLTGFGTQIATTDGLGNYNFTGVRAGTVSICETIMGKVQDQQSSPSSGFNCPNGTIGHSVNVTGGQTVPNLNFGNFALAEVHGRKFIDANGNGVQDQGEGCPGAPDPNATGCAGVTVKLDGTDGKGNNVALQTATAPSGDYGFLGVVPGNYTITIVEPQGFTCSYPTNCSHQVTVESGDLFEDATGFDFGDEPPAQNSDLVVSKKDSYEALAIPGDIPLDADFFSWVIEITNAGQGPATFQGGQVVFGDDLPFASAGNISANPVGNTSGNVSCAAANLTVTCTAQGSFELGSQATLYIDIPAELPSVGTFTNPVGICRVDPNNVIQETSENNNDCSDSMTVAGPDLVVTKSDSYKELAIPGAIPIDTDSFSWEIEISNSGVSSAIFQDGQVVLQDDLPYPATPGPGSLRARLQGNSSGNAFCTTSNLTVTCMATGNLSLGPGAKLQISIEALPLAPGNYTNPAGTCRVDPGNVIIENSESNNDCNSDTITVSGPDLAVQMKNGAVDPNGNIKLGGGVFWFIDITNGGSAAATFQSGQVVLQDDLPFPDDPGSLQWWPGGGNVTGNLNCSVANLSLTCSAANTVVISPQSTLTVFIGAGPASSVGQVTNPVGICRVDPSNSIAELNEGNNDCSDTFNVVGPDLVANLTDSYKQLAIPGDVSLNDDIFGWSIDVTNAGLTAAIFQGGQAVFQDDLPFPTQPNLNGSLNSISLGNITGSVSCTAAALTVTCTANGTFVMSPHSILRINIPASTQQPGTFTNPAGICRADPSNVIPEDNEGNNDCTPDTITVAGPDLSIEKLNTLGQQAPMIGVGQSFKWIFDLSSSNQSAVFESNEVIFEDDLPPNAAYISPTSADIFLSGQGQVGCTLAQSKLTCSATGGSVMLNALTVQLEVIPTKVGTLTNPAGNCVVDPNNVVAEKDEGNNSCNSDSITVLGPDLGVSKSNNLSQQNLSEIAVGKTFTWTFEIKSSLASATFSANDTIFEDDLPPDATYAGPFSPGVISTGDGSVSCSIAQNKLTCLAVGGQINLDLLTVVISVTPTKAGTLTNPAGVCRVDPNNVVAEDDEGNNNCNSDSVNVIAPDLGILKTNNSQNGEVAIGESFEWTIQVTSNAVSAIFEENALIFQDDLPSGANYLGPITTGLVGQGSIFCDLSQNKLTCFASGGPVVLDSLIIVFGVTPTQAGMLSNPAGICRVDPNNLIDEDDEGNNDCSDSVNVSAPDLTISLSNDANNDEILLGQSFVWTIGFNTNGLSARFEEGEVILEIDLPDNATYMGPFVTGFSARGDGVFTCAVAQKKLSCFAINGFVVINSFQMKLHVIPSHAGTLTLPNGICEVDPSNVIVESNEGNNTCSDSVEVKP